MKALNYTGVIYDSGDGCGNFDELCRMVVALNTPATVFHGDGELFGVLQPDVIGRVVYWHEARSNGRPMWRMVLTYKDINMPV
jgi:hypothetical protein